MDFISNNRMKGKTIKVLSTVTSIAVYHRFVLITPQACLQCPQPLARPGPHH